MTNKKWLELIEKNEEKIIEAGIAAYAEALENTHLRYIVEMNEDGEIYTWYDIAGGNSYHMSTHEGRSIEVLHFCFQNYDCEISEDAIIEKLEENGHADMIQELQERAEEDGTSVEVEIINEYAELRYIIDECVKEQKNFEVDEYARENATDQVYRVEEYYSQFE